MKIGMILDEPFPPDPRVENEAITLVNFGHQVFLFCMTFGNQKLQEIYKGIEIKRYKSSRFNHKFSALAYDLPIYRILMKPRISHFIKENNINVLHVHDIRIAAVVFELNKKIHLPIVLDLHENRPEIMKLYPHLHRFPGNILISPKRWKKKEEEFIKKATKIIVVTPHAAKEIRDRTKIDHQKIVVVPNTVRKSFYRKVDSEEGHKNPYSRNFVILYIGDTGIRRGLLTAINATKKLSNKIKNLKLIIVGSSSADGTLRRRVSELQLDKVIQFEGWKEPSSFPSYIENSDLCISPLHKNTHHDTTYANKIFQYMSLGKPLLVSNANAQKEIVEKSNSGLIHEEKNEVDFYDKVMYLYHNKEKCIEFGNNGKLFIEDEFSWEITSKTLIKLYNAL